MVVIKKSGMADPHLHTADPACLSALCGCLKRFHNINFADHLFWIRCAPLTVTDRTDDVFDRLADGSRVSDETLVPWYQELY